MFKRAYVEITNVCNLRCSFCPGTKREKRFMSVQEFETIAGKLREVTDYLYLHVMGEPLLHPALGDMIHIADGLGFRVCLTTNGTLLGDRGEELLAAKGLHKMSVSLHSFEGNDGGDMSGYLETVWAFAEKAAKQGVICALRLWNQGGANTRNGEIETFLAEKCGVDVKTLPTDGSGNRRLGENLFLETAKKFDWPVLDGAERGTKFCYGLRQQIAVLCDGTVVPCCLDGQGTIALGNLLRDDLDDILSSPRAAAIREGFARRQPNEELCRRCGYATRFNKRLSSKTSFYH